MKETLVPPKQKQSLFLSKKVELLIPSCRGGFDGCLFNLKEVFDLHIDHDLKSLQLDQPETQEVMVRVLHTAYPEDLKSISMNDVLNELDCSLQEIAFTSQGQIALFVHQYPQYIEKEKYSTFFVYKQVIEDVDVFYVDHHRSGDMPQTDKLHAIIETDANTCTSLLVNTFLNNQYVNWAIAAAYGDNMLASAEALANQVGLSSLEKSQLKALGIYINYNGYGRSVVDLHFAPEQLFLTLVQYENPLKLIAETNSVFHQLENAYNQDMEKAINAKILADNQQCKAVELPDEAWARRVSGVFGNELANQSPDKAHIVFTINSDDSYTVSLRAPLNNKQGAGDICAEFPTGGGRAAAAGVNKLPAEMINAFIKAVAQYYA